MTTMQTRAAATAIHAAQEHKQFAGTILATDDTQGIVEAIVAVFGNVDEGDDRIMPGAFAKTIQERGLKARVLDQHNTGSIMAVLGKPLELREVGREGLSAETLAAYPEASGGLYAKTQFLLDTEEGRGAYARLKAGAVNEWSIGYDPLDTAVSQEMRDGKLVRVRNLKTLRLWEYSPVIWGMNAATSTVSAKAGAGMDDEAMRKAAGTQGTAKDYVYYEPGPAAMEMQGYPVQRLGDVLQGSIHRVFTLLTDTWYVAGYLNRDERIALSGLIGDALGVLNDGTPAELAMRQVWCAPGVGMDASVGMQMMARDLEVARSSLAGKAGRVLSGSNAVALGEAMAAMMAAAGQVRAVLERAGIIEAEEAGEAEKAAIKAAGAPAPEDDDALLALIDLEAEALRLIAV